MAITGEFARVRALSDGELVSGLDGLLHVSRRAVAEVVMHLGEVEERRLHLLGGFASLFAYCVTRLGMSEDEAYRRIEVARLVRRFPPLFELLAAQRISLSVAALLKSHLTDANHVALLAAVAGKTVAGAREELATLHPRPDVLPGIRKLPTPRADVAPHLVAAGAAHGLPLGDANRAQHSAQLRAPALAPASSITTAPRPSASRPATSRSIEPLSPGKYKVQLTASAELKRKLELARDLLRHAVPSGDLAAILERALDLLLAKTTKRRFGVSDPSRADARATRARVRSTKQAPRAAQTTHRATEAESAASDPVTPNGAPAASSEPGVGSLQSPEAEARPAPSAPPAHAATHDRYLPNHIRRAVFTRDAARCSWQGPDGTRCNSQAWLEHDHIMPRGQGGDNQASNVRLLCRPHNRLAAECAYGRDTIERRVKRRRARESESDSEKSQGSCRVC